MDTSRASLLLDVVDVCVHVMRKLCCECSEAHIVSFLDTARGVMIAVWKNEEKVSCGQRSVGQPRWSLGAKLMVSMCATAAH